MRWAIEVYFKEAKQHLGFLKEQSNHYAAYVASIHLTAIRFCLLVIAKQTQGETSVALGCRNKFICSSYVTPAFWLPILSKKALRFLRTV